jgi:hypothetical protein
MLECLPTTLGTGDSAMDITVTLKEGSKSIYGPETSNNLPAGVMVKYEIKLASAIKDAVVDSTKAKEIKAASPTTLTMR